MSRRLKRFSTKDNSTRTDVLYTTYLMSFAPISWQGSASVFQLTLHKNLNAYHRVLGVENQLESASARQSHRRELHCLRRR
jgi:hypothetical protein